MARLLAGPTIGVQDSDRLELVETQEGHFIGAKLQESDPVLARGT